MSKHGKLVLQDGAVFEGYFLGGAPGIGEVVFSTGMTGYQETLTDPAHCGQVVVMTYPLIGNCGVNALYNQSGRSYFRGYVVSELCEEPSNWRCEGSLRDFLREQKIPCLYGVDTRAVTRHIRDNGAMRGVIASADVDDKELETILNLPQDRDLVAEVTLRQSEKIAGGGKAVAVIDCGAKKSAVAALSAHSYALTLYPAFTGAREILAANPDGIFLSGGPGDPKDLPELIANAREFIKSGVPLFGVGLGYQLLCLALGADTYKMTFGHRGVNHPVKDLAANRVLITTQNHGYALDEKSLPGTGLKVTHVNVSDGTAEGARHEDKPIFGVQYHPGADGQAALFERFDKMMGGLR